MFGCARRRRANDCRLSDCAGTNQPIAGNLEPGGEETGTPAAGSDLESILNPVQPAAVGQQVHTAVRPLLQVADAFAQLGERVPACVLAIADERHAPLPDAIAGVEDQAGRRDRRRRRSG